MTTDKLSSPETKRGRVQRACLEILHEHEADDSDAAAPGGMGSDD